MARLTISVEKHSIAEMGFLKKLEVGVWALQSNSGRPCDWINSVRQWLEATLEWEQSRSVGWMEWQNQWEIPHKLIKEEKIYNVFWMNFWLIHKPFTSP